MCVMHVYVDDLDIHSHIAKATVHNSDCYQGYYCPLRAIIIQ